MKKTLVMVLAIMIAMLSIVSVGVAEEKTYKVMLSNAYYTAPYGVAYDEAAAAAAEELGIELVILDAAGSQLTQLEHANTAIAEGYDGFIYFPADVDGAGPVIDALNESGIAWMGVNAYDGEAIDEVGMTYYVGPDASDHARNRITMIKQLLPEGGNLVLIAGSAGHYQTALYDQLYSEQLGEEYKWLARVNCDFSDELAMNAMTDILTAHADEIQLIVAEDGAMLKGVVQSLQAAGVAPGTYFLPAGGSNMSNYELLKEGWFSAISTQDPMAEGRLAVEVMLQILTDPENAPKGWTKLPTPIATAETADEFNWF